MNRQNLDWAFRQESVKQISHEIVVFETGLYLIPP